MPKHTTKSVSDRFKEGYDMGILRDQIRDGKALIRADVCILMGPTVEFGSVLTEYM